MLQDLSPSSPPAGESGDEIARLRERLEATEAALAAIRAGDADSIIGPNGVVGLRGAEKPYQVFFAAMGQGGLTLDTAGRILHSNPCFAAMLETDVAVLRGSLFIELLPPETRQEIAALLLRANAESIETMLCAPSGRTTPVILTIRSVMIGAQHFSCIVVTDITERKLHEHEMLRAKEAAEAASIAKSAFLANMSHEIRTPLNAITGMAYLMKHAGMPREQEERLGKIETASRHLLEILSTILDLSKIEAGKFLLEDRDVDVQAIIDQVITIFSGPASARNLSLFTENTVPCIPLRGDATRLQQALANFVGNSIKFTHEGRITLRACLIEENSANVLLRFEVCDTGIGIPAEVIPWLFSNFEQADNSTTRRYGGTGLGLAITKQLAQLMGGEVGVDSQPGQGSHFWMTTRLRKEPAGIAGEVNTPQLKDAIWQLQYHAGKRILLAEDEAINREIFQGILADVGLIVDTVCDGREAIEHVRHQHYNAILMDIQMPRMDGIQATRVIRQLPLASSTPIIALTANAFAEDRSQCMDAGMNDFITKPADPEKLLSILAKWLSPVSA